MLSGVLAASGGDSGTAAGTDSGNNSGKKGGAGKAVLTVKDYDLQELRRMGSAVFFECLSASYMHFVTKVSGVCMVWVSVSVRTE